MPKYIDADEFVSLTREWYCEACEKRKGMKRGRLQFVYEIGGAPCRACDVDDVISDIEEFPAADVEPVAHGYWVKSTGMMPPEFAGNYHCSECGWHGINAKEREYKRCPECGAKMLPEPPKGEKDDRAD